MSGGKRRLSLATTGVKVVAALDGNMRTYDLRHDRRAQTDDIVIEVSVQAIDVSPWQHRIAFDEADLRAMAASFGPDGRGLAQPPIVRPKADGRYELVAGERRLRAAKLVPLERIRVLVRELDDRAARIAGAMENIERDSLAPFELSHAMLDAVEAYREDGGRANAGAGSIASEWGLSRPVVSEHLAVARNITRETLLLAGAQDASGQLHPRVIRGLSLSALKHAAKASTNATKLARLRDAIDALRCRTAKQRSGGHAASDAGVPIVNAATTKGEEGDGMGGGEGAAARAPAAAEQGFRKQIRKAIVTMTAAEAERHLDDLVPVVTALAERVLGPGETRRVLSNSRSAVALIAVLHDRDAHVDAPGGTGSQLAL